MTPYMRVLVLSLAVPFLVSLWPPLGFWRHWRSLIFSIGVIFFVFGAWDVLATLRGHWSFAPDKTTALPFINLPLEELLFFIVIPFCVIFTWEAILWIAQKVRP